MTEEIGGVSEGAVAALRPTLDGRPDQLIETADAALYEAKRGGRNRVASTK